MKGYSSIQASWTGSPAQSCPRLSKVIVCRHARMKRDGYKKWHKPSPSAKCHRMPDTLALGTITANCFDSLWCYAIKKKPLRVQTPLRQRATSAITSLLVTGSPRRPASLRSLLQLFASLQHEQNLSLLAGSQLNFILPNLKDLYGSNFSLNCKGIFENKADKTGKTRDTGFAKRRQINTMSTFHWTRQGMSLSLVPRG